MSCSAPFCAFFLPADDLEYGAANDDPLGTLNKFLEPLNGSEWSKAIYPPPASFMVDDAAAVAMSPFSSPADRGGGVGELVGGRDPASAIPSIMSMHGHSAAGSPRPLDGLGRMMLGASMRWRQNQSFKRMPEEAVENVDESEEEGGATDTEAEGYITSPVALLRCGQRRRVVAGQRPV